MRIDVHVHSKYSTRPSQWILKKIGCPESFTEPLQLYQIAKNRGMSHVTISDHNTIDGALAIAHLPDTFISEEVTTYFPENGCKVHVLALNINEALHHEIQKIRENIYDLASYLKRENILCIVAHPLYAINDKLTVENFEQMLLLFQNFEINGARNARENETLRMVLSCLNEAKIIRLADKHKRLPLYPRAWEKRLWGSSDDHSALNIARTYTRIKDMKRPELLTADAALPEIEVNSRPSTPLTMAHNLYGIAYQYYCSKFNLTRYSDKDVLMQFLDRNLKVNQNTQPGLLSRLYLLWSYRKDKNAKRPVSDSLVAMLRHESRRLIQDDPQFFEQTQGPVDYDHQEKRWYAFVNRASKRVMLHFGDNLLGHLSGANLFDIFSTVGSAGGLYTLLAPYFVAYSQFAKDRTFSETIKKHFDPVAKDVDDRPFRLAHFTDTYYEVNGVAKTLQQQVHYAMKNNMSYSLITCRTEGATDQPGVCNFKPIGTYELPEYPEQKIFYPPFLEMLAYCYDEQIDHIHTATPGPVGLAALAIAKILKLPISGTYHTAIPQYAQILTGDEAIEELTWKYVLWYYDQLDVIYAPSQSTRDELITKGVHPNKIKLYPRGIDVEFFHPAKRNGVFKKTYPFPLADGVKLLYVGRVSKEKNLNLLADAFKQLLREGHKIQLVVAGDGPYLEEMRSEMKGLPCCFTGYLKGEILAAVYASSDLFVFPSATDTFGNVVLEAQASGLPVVVSDQGGPCENLIDQQTGLICKSNDTRSLLDAMRTLISSPETRRAMGQAARRYVEERSFENAFLEMWALYQVPLPAIHTVAAAARQ
ncbi:MAG: glycosyltransferase [Desulfobacteraceae bacterium]|nr:glycosyltransferase [Desulfobacteraceae bacterium]